MDMYVIGLIVGGGLLLLSLLGGHDGPEAGHLEHPGASDLASWLGLRTVVSFVAFFGLAGVLGGLAGLGAGPRLVTALVTGLAVGGLTAWAFGLARTRGDVTSGAGPLAGRTGQVVVPPAPGRVGRVAVTVAGQARQAPAHSAETLAVGDTVIVIGHERGVLDVRRWDGR